MLAITLLRILSKCVEKYVRNIQGRVEDLSSVLDTAVSDSKGVDGPFLIESVVSLAKRQAFPKSCFIDLDNLHKTTKQKVRISLCTRIAIAETVI